MRSLAEIIKPVRVPPRRRNTWRRGSLFIKDTKPFHSKLDRNARAKLLHFAETAERFSKLKGRRNGFLGLSGLHLLRALVLHCLGADGLCCPSYAHLQRITGLSRSTIAAGMARLEKLGILARTRRLKRQWIERTSPITGERERIQTTTQDSTLLQLRLPDVVAGGLWRLPQLFKPSSPDGRESTKGLAMWAFGRPLRLT